MRLAIQGIGLATPIGGKEELKAAIGAKATTLSDSSKTDTSSLGDFIPARKLRRIDHFTRMSLLAAYRALQDAGKLEDLPPRLGIVITTGYGPSQTTFDFLDSIIEDGAHLASPLAFSHSVHNIPAGVLSMQLGIPCPQTTICQLRQPVTAGLRTAALWLADGTADTVLFGAIDESTPLLDDNMSRLTSADDAHVGEGATFFLLNSSDKAMAHVDLSPPTDTSHTLIDDEIASLWGKTPTHAAFSLAAAALIAEKTEETWACKEGATMLHIAGARND